VLPRRLLIIKIITDHLARAAVHLPVEPDAWIGLIGELRAQIGSGVRQGDWHTVAQAEVDKFSEMSGEAHWIHKDSERATASQFGGPIAQGTLLLAMTPALPRTAPVARSPWTPGTGSTRASHGSGSSRRTAHLSPA
jgi:acyl dehydratase